MTALTGQTIASSFEQLLHTDTDGGLSTSLVAIKDGDNGITSALKLARDKVEVLPSGANSTTAFEVSQNDGTAILTINSTTPGATITGTATISGDVDITSTTAATDATGDTGALRCEGGASIADDIYVGEHVYLAATKILYLDGGGNSYIHEAAADRVIIVAGGENRVVANATGVGFGKTPSKKIAIGMATSDLDIEDAGTASASSSGSVNAWIEVRVGTTDGYIKVYDTK